MTLTYWGEWENHDYISPSSSCPALSPLGHWADPSQAQNLAGSEGKQSTQVAESRGGTRRAQASPRVDPWHHVDLRALSGMSPERSGKDKNAVTLEGLVGSSDPPQGSLCRGRKMQDKTQHKTLCHGPCPFREDSLSLHDLLCPLGGSFAHVAPPWPRVLPPASQ